MSARLQFQESFWNDKARENAQFHIVSDMVMWDDQARDAAFDRMGAEGYAEMAPFCRPEDAVLDLGCGMGRIIKHLAPHVRSVIGVDISNEMLERGRRYLSHLPNIDLRKTTGSVLPEVGDESIDFLYSVLCLIHVDKRSAWQYFEEIRRVLKPGGLARLQFHNILAPEGLQKFIESARNDYPMEFYSPQELKLMFERLGIEVILPQFHGMFIDAWLIKGSADEWRARARGSVRFETEFERPVEEGAPLKIDRGLKWRVRFENTGDSWRGFRFAYRMLDSGQLADPGGEVQHGDAILRIPPHGKGELAIEVAKAAPWLRMEQIEGTALLSHVTGQGQSAARPAEMTLLAAFLPAGFEWGQEEAARWPGASWIRPAVD